MSEYIKKAFKYFCDKDYRFAINSGLGLYNNLSDKEYVSRTFKSIMKYDLDLDNPKTYNEKIQWLKLYNQKSEYTKMVDKHTAKEYVANIIGEEYIIPTIGVYNCFDEINFDRLPNQFVMKCTHDSGGVVICKNKSQFDYSKAKKTINKYLKRDFYKRWREWPYKYASKKIIIEKYMEDDETKELRDYKFFVFDGKVKALFIASDRQNEKVETKFDFFDENFKHLPITNGHPNAAIEPNKPANFDLMKEFAEKIAAGIPHVRVDFYEINGKVYFGEITFFHWSGLVSFEPNEWDYTFGDWIKLPDVKVVEDNILKR